MAGKEINKLPLVVIFGRVNVGKSTLFNCLTEKNAALVSKTAGTTRDANTGQVKWNNRQFKIIDTGGIIDIKNFTDKLKRKNTSLGGKTDDIDAKVQAQARQYLELADMVLFVTDARDGLMPQDRQMAAIVKKIGANVILAANKADSPNLRRETAEFNQLGFGEPMPVSAASGSGTGDLLDAIISKLPNHKQADKETGLKSETTDPSPIKVCIIGRPNVGKSSLINELVGEEKIIVSAVPHTTREPQDLTINYQGKVITLIDTAGLSRQGQKSARQKKFQDSLEKLSITKSLHALSRADIALLVIDATAGIDRQDQKIVDEILERKAGLIIIANKWDLIKEKDTKKFISEIYGQLPFITWAPIHFCSALTGEKVNKIPKLILEIDQARKITVADNALGHFLNKIIRWHKPVRSKFAKRPRLRELRQTGVNPPAFSIKIGAKENLQYSYLRFIENRLREKFGLLGTPIIIWVDKDKKVHGQGSQKE